MKKIILPVLIAALVASAGAARAENACLSDLETLCPGVEGSQERLSCLEEKKDELSPKCGRQVAYISARVKEIGAACNADAQSLCAETKKGGGALLQCLAQNGDKLSAPCQEQVKKVEEKTAAFKKACGADVEKSCKEVKKGQGRVLACLQEQQQDTLAPDCGAFLVSLAALVKPAWEIEAAVKPAWEIEPVPMKEKASWEIEPVPVKAAEPAK